MIHDGDALAELVGLLHIMRRQQHGEPLRVERANADPKEQARLRIKAVGRLFQEEYVGRMHQGTASIRR